MKSAVCVAVIALGLALACPAICAQVAFAGAPAAGAPAADVQAGHGCHGPPETPDAPAHAPDSQGGAGGCCEDHTTRALQGASPWELGGAVPASLALSATAPTPRAGPPPGATTLPLFAVPRPVPRPCIAPLRL